jgi:hypothetical protein
MASITISMNPSQMPPSLPPIDFDASSHDLCYTVCQKKYGVSFHFPKGFTYQVLNIGPTETRFRGLNMPLCPPFLLTSTSGTGPNAYIIIENYASIDYAAEKPTKANRAVSTATPFTFPATSECALTAQLTT